MLNNYMKYGVIRETGSVVLKLNVTYIILMMFASTALFSAQGIQLHFKDSVLINSKVVYLGEIAEIGNAADNHLIQVLEKTEIGNAAPAGFSRFFNADDIIHFILKPRFKDAQFTQAGAKRVKVRTDSDIKNISNYEKQIFEYLQDNIAWNTEDYSISIENNQAQWHTYPGASTIEVKGLNTPCPRGNIQLKLVVNQGDKQQVIAVMCRIKVETPVVTARNTIARDKIITDDDLELSRVDITGFRSVPFTDKSLIKGKMATRTLTPGTIIQEYCVKNVPEVCKGDVVFMVIKKGPIRVSVPARAREQGIKGERIWVENLDTHKLIRVKIEGKGIVHPNEGESI